MLGLQSGSSIPVYCGNPKCAGNFNKVILFYLYNYGPDRTWQYCKQCGIKLDVTDLEKKVEELKVAQTQTQENLKDKEIRELKEKLAEVKITEKVEKRVEKKIKKRNQKADIWEDVIKK